MSAHLYSQHCKLLILAEKVQVSDTTMLNSSTTVDLIIKDLK